MAVMNVTRLSELPAQPSLEDEAALMDSMSRHPAGKKLLSRACPTCGQNASGALGDADDRLLEV